MKSEILWPLIVLILLSFMGSLAQAQDPAMEDYTAYPMFITSGVQPNILIVLDNSASMNQMAYGYHEGGDYHPDDFGAIVSGSADAGSGDSTLVDSSASFSETVSEGDILHNIDDGSSGTITTVSDDHTLVISGGMSAAHTNDSGERYWVEHLVLKDPSAVEEGYYGYFVPTARFTISNNIFVRDDINGEWSGSFLNWLTMRRVDVSRKVLMGGLATSRTGGGNQHNIGESPAVGDYKFMKVVSDPSGYSPYDSRHFYKIADGYIEVYKIDDGEPDLDYIKDFTLQDTLNSDDDHILADYEFDYVGQDTYEIRWLEAHLNGVADSQIDRNGDGSINESSSYRYYLYDSSKDFIDIVQVDERFVNESEGSNGYVSSVPETVDELLNSLPDEILYDMFHDDGDGFDSYVKCARYCEPDEDYLPCQGYGDFASCSAGEDLQTQLAPLIGHIVIFSTPLDPFGPNAGEAYHFEGRSIRATQVDRIKVEVARDQTQPDEARDFADGNIAGVLQKIGEKARFGLEFYNDSQGGRVVREVGSNMTDLITQIENTSCDTWTPLAESVYEGLRYYQQVDPYYGNDYGTNNQWDPFYFGDMGEFVECPKSFILHITDGESTQDQDIPVELQDYDGDGTDPGSYPNNGSDYLDDVTLWGHTTDLRSDLPDDGGRQDVAYYTVFAFGQGSRLLKDAAINGGFWDLDGNNRPSNSDEWDRDQDGLPDTYYEAPQGFQLESKIYQAITDILKRAASGTAVSVLSTSERGEGTVYQAFFRPKVTENLEDITWLGYLQCLWVDSYGNMREDTVADGRLVLSEDKIICYRFDDINMQTIVDRFADADGDGEIDNVDSDGDPIPDDSVLLDDFARSIWEAGRMLASRNPSDRQIITFGDSDWDGVVDADEQLDFTTADLSQFEAYLDVVGEDASSYSYLGAVDERAEDLVGFIRGEQVSGLRNRQITVNGSLKTWKLGDIVFSTPTIVTAPSQGYEKLYSDKTYWDFMSRWKDRQGMIYIGANDGMLHAFRAGRFIANNDPDTDKNEVGYYEETNLGSEAWAYVPLNLLPHLKWLAHPDYTHVYYVDPKMKAIDVKIFNDDNEHPDGWGTLLIGGMRLGGGPYPSGIVVDGEEKIFRSGYFLIDVTNPESPEVLAEFSHPQMGFTTSYPAVTKVGDHWYLIVGSGPTAGAAPPYNYDGTSDQVGRIFVLDLTQFMSNRQIREGQELHIFEGSDNDAFMADPISVDMPLDFSADVIYVGETYWGANKWQGKMLRLKTNGSTDPTNWQLSTLFQASANQSVTAAPSASTGFNNDLWVYFGTGRFFSDPDKVDTNTQSFYGIHDECMEGGSCSALSSNDLLDVTQAQVFVDESVSNVSGADDFTELEGKLSGSASAYDGWKLDLQDSGERALSKPSVLGGALLFTSYIPNPDICSIGGDGKLYGLFFLTGTAHHKAILGKEPDTNESIKSVDTGKGMPSSLGMHVGTREGATGFIQTSTGNIVRGEVTPPLNYKSGTISWRQF